MDRYFIRSLMVSVFCGIAFYPFAALAKPDEISSAAPSEPKETRQISAAQTLYERATSEMDQNNLTVACPMLEEVAALVPEALGVKMTLGECYEAQGKLASAWSQYMLVLEPARRQGQVDRADKAARKMGALADHLATLKIRASEQVRKLPGLFITDNGLPIVQPRWDVQRPVDLGIHKIRAWAPGHKVWTQEINIQAEGMHVSIEIDRLIPEIMAAPKEPVVLHEEPNKWYRLGGIGFMGLGTGGLIVGSIMGGLSMARRDASNNDGHCGNNDFCDEEGIRLRDEALVFGDASTALFAIGLMFVGTGVALWADSSSPVIRSAGIKRAEVSSWPGGLMVKGSF